MGYLIISRRKNERIAIGEKIEIIIAEITADKVEVGIRAPREFDISRLESHIEELRKNEYRHNSDERNQKNRNRPR